MRTAALLVAVAAAGAQAAPVDYQLTPTHSFVHFEWSHRGLSTLSGRFDKVSGSVQLDRAARSGGERSMTNLLHVAELLHAAASEQHLGPAGVLRWFDERTPPT